jgi:hypothetical protein
VHSGNQSHSPLKGKHQLSEFETPSAIRFCHCPKSPLSKTRWRCELTHLETVRSPEFRMFVKPRPEAAKIGKAAADPLSSNHGMAAVVSFE